MNAVSVSYNALYISHACSQYVTVLKIVTGLQVNLHYITVYYTYCVAVLHLIRISVGNFITNI